MAERRIIGRDEIYELSGFDTNLNKCRQADIFSAMFPSKLDIDSDAPALMAATQAAGDRGLDVVFVACMVALPRTRDPFVEFTIEQRVSILGMQDSSEAAKVMANEPTQSTDRYRLASSILRDIGGVSNGQRAYQAAVSAQKGARAIQGKLQARAIKEEQNSFWVEQLRRLRDKEMPTLQELPVVGLMDG